MAASLREKIAINLNRNTEKMKHKDEANKWDVNDQDSQNEESKTEAQTENMNEDINGLPDANVEEVDPIAKMEVELSEQKDKFLRLYSEFENYKKRVSRERVEQLKFASIDTYLTFLPVIDDFERAQKSMEDAKELDAVREGVKLIYNKFKSAIESKGVVPMLSIGTPFDPELHDAISNIPAPKEDMKGMVIDEIEKGYLLHDKVIRHAKVIVGN